MRRSKSGQGLATKPSSSSQSQLQRFEVSDQCSRVSLRDHEEPSGSKVLVLQSYQEHQAFGLDMGWRNSPQIRLLPRKNACTPYTLFIHTYTCTHTLHAIHFVLTHGYDHTITLHVCRVFHTCCGTDTLADSHVHSHKRLPSHPPMPFQVPSHTLAQNCSPQLSAALAAFLS